VNSAGTHLASKPVVFDNSATTQFGLGLVFLTIGGQMVMPSRTH
jgi:hypothetical protein